MKKCGIYIVKNSVNDKVYIGQSVNIGRRWLSHKASATSKGARDYNTKLHTAMRKFGIDKFHYEILEECGREFLDEKEEQYIEKYDSIKNGYNMKKGGNSTVGERNPRAIVTEEQVLEITKLYGQRVPFRKAYAQFSDVISKRGFRKIWTNETWQYVAQEVYTEENLRWHSHQAKSFQQKRINNAQRALPESEILKIRELRKTGLSYAAIGRIVNRNTTTVRKYCLMQEIKPCVDAVNRIAVRNIETGLVFESITAASKWCNGNVNYALNSKKGAKTAGTVPTTGQVATWEKI